MNDMQMTMLNMMQKAASTKPSASQETKSKDKAGNGFRDMMDKAGKQTEAQDTKQPDVEHKEVTEPVSDDKQTLDMYTLQELAAMQLFCADATQNVVVQDVEVEQPQQVEALFAQPADTVVDVVEAPKSQPEMEGDGTAMMQNMEQKQEAPAEPAAPELKEAAPQKNELGDVTAKQSRDDQGAVEQVKVERTEEKLPEDAPEGVETKVFTKVETAPIKVSEAAEEPAQPKSVEEQVTHGLKEALTKGETKVELQLTPEHLGKITIELIKQENGALHVALHAENSHTKALLERDLPNMQNLLSRDTQQDVLVEVHSQQEAQQKEFYDGHQHQNRQQQEEQHHQQKSGGDFLNQLRLGLVSEEEEAI